MKLNFLNKNRTSYIFLFVIAVLPSLFFIKPLKIKTDFFSMLPKEKISEMEKTAYEKVLNNASGRITILFSHKDKNTSVKAAKHFFNKIKHIKEIEFLKPKKNTDKLINFFSKYKYKLLSENNKTLLTNNNFEKIQQKAMQYLYSPISFKTGDFLNTDPFLLFYDYLINLPFLKSKMMPYQDILISNFNNEYHTFMSLSLTEKDAFSIKKLDTLMQELNASTEETKDKYQETKITLTGIPIHTYTATQKSIKEINIISIITIFGILFLIYLGFKTLKPFVFAIASIVIGFLTGLIITNFIFSEIHILTIIFGTSLIGVSIDYSLHFFAEIIEESNLDSTNIIKKILPGITMGLITSVIGYFALLATPFPSLQQISVFSIFGIIAAYLSVLFLYPKFYKISKNKRENNYRFYHLTKNTITKIKNRKKHPLRNFGIISIILIISLPGIFKLKPSDDIRSFFTTSQELIEREKFTQEVLGQNIGTQFFLITAKTQEKMLEKEEDISKNLKKLIENNTITGYQSISQITPSIKTQKENYALTKKLIQNKLKQQTNFLGLDNQKYYTIKTDFIKNKTEYLTLENIKNFKTLNILNNLYLGKIENKFASVILLNNVNPKNIDKLEQLSEINNGIYFMDKAGKISKTLSKYRLYASISLVFVYLLIFIILLFRYKTKKALAIITPPFTSAAITLGLLGYLGYTINLFNIMALFLILGIGIDYTIFYAENKNHIFKTSFAVLLSAITTLLSFSVLMLSSFPIIHTFGITILIGITSAYILSHLNLKNN